MTAKAARSSTIDPGCPPAQVAGQTCVYDYGPWNLLIPESERTGLLLLGHKALTPGDRGVHGNRGSAQHVGRPGRTDTAG